MNNNRFVNENTRSRRERDTLLFDDRRLEDIPFPFGEAESATVVNDRRVPSQIDKGGWQYKPRNVIGGDVYYNVGNTSGIFGEIPGMEAKVLAAGAGINSEKNEKENLISTKSSVGLNANAARIAYSPSTPNGNVRVAVNGPGVDLNYYVNTTQRKFLGMPFYTGGEIGGTAKATILTGDADGRIEFPLRKTFNAPLWKIPSNIIGALRGERKARPGDLKLVLSGGVEGGAAV